MPLPSYTYSGAVYSSPAVGTATFNLTTSGGAAIGFLDPSHIHVYTTLDGGATLVERFRPAQWEFNTARTQVTLVVPTVANEAVIVRRITPITGPLIDVPDGINLPAQRLRDVNLYNLYVTQEQYEANAAALALATDANTQVGLVLANVANQLPYTLYANRAAVPTNPGSAVSGEVLDSTLMQTFTPLTGVPAGFIGSASLIVRIRYNTTLATWQWIDYRAANADSRYLLKTQLVNSASSSSTVDPPTANAVKVAFDKGASAQTSVDALAVTVGNIQTTVASQYAIVSNVVSIPAGTSGLRIDITNSTGIESFTPLTGRPSGFVGSASLSVRLLYSAIGATWEWVDYRAVDPDGRYSGVNFTQSGTGAVGRSVTSKFKDVVSVKDFGAVGDGVTDDTVAIQAAINYIALILGGGLFFPKGRYKLTSALSLAAEGIVLFGDSRWSTELVQTALNSKILDISGISCGVKSLCFRYTGGTPVSGATAIHVSNAFATISDFIIRSSHIGVHFEGANAVGGKLSQFEILDYESCGVLADGISDLYLSQFIMNAGLLANRGAVGGIRLVNKVEGFMATDGDILLGMYSLTMDTPGYVSGTRPGYNNFTNILFDSSSLSPFVYKCVETEFVGCWFSNGRSGAGNAGLRVASSNKIRFTNCRFINCGSYGCMVESTAENITFTSCSFESNSVTTGAGVAHGLYFTNNTSKFNVIGCTASNGILPGTQGYGIFIGAGCKDYNLIGNNVLGNVQSTGLLDAGSQPKNVYGNIGFKTVGAGLATINSGATSLVITHGLNLTPELKNITLTRTSGSGGGGELYVTGVTSTQFTINTVPAPTSAITLAWQVRASDS